MLLVATLACNPTGAAQDDSDPLPMSEVAPGVHVHTGSHQPWSNQAEDVADVAFVVGTDCVAVIDTGGSPRTGARLLAAIRLTTALPICFVINTHMHPDHVLGNAALTGETPPPIFVAHARLEASLAARAPYYLRALQRDSEPAPTEEQLVHPTWHVANSATLELGGRTLQLQAWPTAHTDNDLTIYDDQTATLFTGDLLFIGHLPVIDGSLSGWLEVVDRLRALPARLVVPGHGEPTTDVEAAFTRERTYLTTVRDEVRAAIQGGVTMSRTIEQLSNSGTAGWELADDFHRRNLTAAYAELEWED